MEFARGSNLNMEIISLALFIQLIVQEVLEVVDIKTHEQIADQRDVVWDKELLKKNAG